MVSFSRLGQGRPLIAFPRPISWEHTKVSTIYLVRRLNNSCFITEAPTILDMPLMGDYFDPATAESYQQPDSTRLNDASSNDNYMYIDQSRILDYSPRADTFDSVLNVPYQTYESAPAARDYSLPSSLVSSNASLSFPAFHRPSSYEDHRTHFPEIPDVINSPSFGTSPASYDSSSPGTSEWSTTSEGSNTSPITALETFESGADSITSYPTYPLDFSSMSDVVVDHASSARTPHDTNLPSASYSSLGGALEGEPAVNERHVTHGMFIPVFAAEDCDSQEY